MRVCKQSLAQIGLAVIAAPHLRPAQIETLIPRKAVNEGRFLALQGQLVSIVGNGQTCKVGNILAQRQLALYMLTRQRRSEEHTSELQSLMRISYAVFCLKKKKTTQNPQTHTSTNNQN